MDDRFHVALAVVFGVLLPTAVALVLLWLGS
jgi:hypothetical protein